MNRPRRITAASCNFELNDDGDYPTWLAMHERLARLDVTFLCRRETFGYTPIGPGARLFAESKRILKRAGELSPGKHATALYYDPEVFEHIDVWDTDWPSGLLQPTAMPLRVRGTRDVDLVAGSGHLHYNSPTQRKAQAENPPRLADRVGTYADDDGPLQRKLPVLVLGLGANSYVDRGQLGLGEQPLPRLTKINDAQHRAHRNYESVTAEQVMDCQPDRILLMAALADAARHSALLPAGPGTLSRRTHRGGERHPRAGPPGGPHLLHRLAVTDRRARRGRPHDRLVGSRHPGRHLRPRPGHRDPGDPVRPRRLVPTAPGPSGPVRRPVLPTTPRKPMMRSMPLACEQANPSPTKPARLVPVPDSSVAIPLTVRDLTIVRLTAGGYRRTEIAAACGCSPATVDLRTHYLCTALGADNREHLAALSAAFGLVTREHLDAVPTTRPGVDDDDQCVLELVAAGLSGQRIASRLHRPADGVWAAIRRLISLFHAGNRCRLGTFAVLTGAVACHAVSPRFAPHQLPGHPPLGITTTGTGVLLHAPLPITPTQPGQRSDSGRPTAAPGRTRAAVQPAPARGASIKSAHHSPSVPETLATWAENLVGGRPAWLLPDDGTGAHCWGISTLQGTVELRITRTHGDLEREVYAHRYAVDRLTSTSAPRLLGIEPRLRALLIRQPRGERMDDSSDMGPRLRESVHEQAGGLLRVLHTSTPAVGGDQHGQAVRNTLRYLDSLTSLLDLDVPALTEHRTLLQHRLTALREVVPQLPHGFCHGAFGPTAWRWQPAHRAVALTGFTHSQMMAAVTDFARPSLLWGMRLGLQHAFARGYGRPLDLLEQQVVGDFAVLAGVQDLWRAGQRGDAEAHRQLAEAVHAAVKQLPAPKKPDAAVQAVPEALV